MNRKRRGFRFTKWFFLIMLICLFFSRSISYFLTPKVLTARPRSGTLIYTLTAQSAGWHCDNEHRITLDGVLSEGIIIESVDRRKGDIVRPGERLIGFSALHGEYLLKNAETAYAQAQDALIEWDHQYEMEIMQLQNKLENTSTRKQINEANIGMYDPQLDVSLDLEIDEIAYSLKYLESERIVQGKSRTVLENELMFQKNEMDCLYALKRGEWSIFSDIEGRVMDIVFEKNDRVDGSLPLAIMAPRDSILSIQCSLSENDQSILVGEKISVPWTESLTIDFHRVVGTDSDDETVLLTPNIEDMLWDVKSIPDPLTLIVTSEKYDILVPNRAVVNNTVYLLRERESFLGKQLYAEAVMVRAWKQDDVYTVILSGLSRDDEIITNWDRALSSNDVVMRPMQ